MNTSRTFAICFALLVAAHLLLMWFVRLYPFVDIPYHLAETTIYRHYDEAANQFREFYSKLSGFRPNTFHLMVGGSPLFPDVETAYKFLFCIYVLLLPLSVLIYTRTTGGDLWTALLSFLLLYNFNVHWGFIGFSFSIPVLVFLAAASVRHFASNGILPFTAVMVLLIAILIVHPLTAMFALGLFFTSAAWQFKRQLKVLCVKLIPAIPAIILTMRWWFGENSQGEQWGLQDFARYYSAQYLESLPVRARLLTNDFSFLLEGPAGAIAGTIFSLIILLSTSLIYLKQRGLDHSRPNSASLPFFFLILAALCWFFAPGFVRGQTHIFDRFSVFVLLGAILLAAQFSAYSLITKPLKVLIAAAALVYTILWSHYFFDFSKETATFTKEIFPAEQGKTLCGVIYDNRFRGRRLYQHFPAYYIVWNHQIACVRFIDLRYSPAIRRKADFKLLGRYNEMTEGNLTANALRYETFDSLLVRMKRHNPPNRARAFRLTKSAPPWFLYERSRRR